MVKVTFHAYCGMSNLPKDFDDVADAREYVANRIQRVRKLTKVAILERGECWEIYEPENAAMVPDYAGTLRLQHITFECAECGCGCETKDEARQCCSSFDPID